MNDSSRPLVCLVAAIATIAAGASIFVSDATADPAEKCAEYKAEGVPVPVLGRPLVALLASPKSYLGCRVYTEGYLDEGMMLYFSSEDLNYDSEINGLFIGNDLGEDAVHPRSRDRSQLIGHRVEAVGVFSVGPGLNVGSIEDIELLKVIEVRKEDRKTLPPE